MLRHRTSRRSYSEISRKNAVLGFFFEPFLEAICHQKVIFSVRFSEILGDFCIFSENLEENAENAKNFRESRRNGQKKLLFGDKLPVKKVQKKAQNYDFSERSRNRISEKFYA